MWKTINETNQDIFNHDREIIDKWDEKYVYNWLVIKH